MLRTVKWIWILFIQVGFLGAQETSLPEAELRQESSPWLKFNGGLQMIGEYQSHNVSGSVVNPTSQDQFYGRMILSARMTLFQQITLPFELYLSTQEVGYRQPFNQFGASLQVAKWLRIHGGYFSLSLSPLTFGDQRILGGGIELSPQNFVFSFLYGLGRHARLPQADFPGEYDRWFWAAKIGHQENNGFALSLTLMHAIDDSTSLPDTINLPAMENFTASLATTIPMASFLRLSGEFAVAMFTRDISFPVQEDFPSSLHWLFTPRYSSNVDGAAKLQLSITPQSTWGVQIQGEWIGPGYVSLGYTQLLNDIARVTLSPSFRIFDSKVFLSGSIGIQQNNLLDNKLATTTRLIGSASISAQLYRNVNLSGSYSNYGIRSNHSNDTLRVSTISQMLNITPSWQFLTGKISHSLSLAYSYSEVSDKNVYTAQTQNFQGHALTFTHSFLLPSQWSFTSSVFWSENEAGSNPAPSMLNVSEAVSKTLLNKQLKLTVNLGYGKQTIGIQSTENLILRFSGNYSMKDFGNLALLLLLQQSASDQVKNRQFHASLNYSIHW